MVYIAPCSTVSVLLNTAPLLQHTNEKRWREPSRHQHIIPRVPWRAMAAAFIMSCCNWGYQQAQQQTVCLSRASREMATLLYLSWFVCRRLSLWNSYFFLHFFFLRRLRLSTPRASLLALATIIVDISGLTQTFGPSQQRCQVIATSKFARK